MQSSCRPLTEQHTPRASGRIRLRLPRHQARAIYFSIERAEK